jgi:hypothetical protein
MLFRREHYSIRVIGKLGQFENNCHEAFAKQKYFARGFTGQSDLQTGHVASLSDFAVRMMPVEILL